MLNFILNKEICNIMENKILIETSARHIHVTEEHLAILFGEGAKLTHKKVTSSEATKPASALPDNCRLGITKLHLCCCHSLHSGVGESCTAHAGSPTPSPKTLLINWIGVGLCFSLPFKSYSSSPNWLSLINTLNPSCNGV